MHDPPVSPENDKKTVRLADTGREADPGFARTLASGGDTAAEAVAEEVKIPGRETFVTAPTLGAPSSSAPPAFSSRRDVSEGDGLLDGRYEVKRELGRGGMGRVLLVFDEKIRRNVALKQLFQDSATRVDPSEGRSTIQTRRFLREIRLSGRLEHPSIVPIHDLGDDGNGYFYTMRYIQGQSLAAALEAATDLPARLHLLPNFRDVCNAMAFAHSRRVLHRDLKPANVVLGEYGETMVVDWGLAKMRDDTDEADTRLVEELEQLRKEEFDPQHTVAGSALGTPSYMAPEQALGRLEEIDDQSDIYSLGAMLYELLTGAPPFSADTVHALLLQVIDEPLTPVREREPAAPAELAAIAEKALCKDKGGRYASCAELAADLTAYLSGEKVSTYNYSNWELVRRFVRRNRLLVAACLVALVALAGTAVFMTRAYRHETIARREATQAARREADARRSELVQKEVAQTALSRKTEQERTTRFRCRKRTRFCSPDRRRASSGSRSPPGCCVLWSPAGARPWRRWTCPPTAGGSGCRNAAASSTCARPTGAVA